LAAAPCYANPSQTKSEECEMAAKKRFTATDYNRMAKELEAMADTIHQHPEMNHHTSQRLKAMAKEMRDDADSEYLVTHPSSDR